MSEHKQIKVSIRAYYLLKSKAKSEEYRGRGIIGVIDKMLFDEFTTQGSGRPYGTTGIKKKKQKKC